MFLGILPFVLLGITDGNPWGILLTFVTGIGFFVGVISMIAIGIFQLAVVIFASLKAKDGQMYHYPFNLRLI
jgi:uncharacterized Tic20 family protein